jgi:hypothetical protein
MTVSCRTIPRKAASCRSARQTCPTQACRPPTVLDTLNPISPSNQPFQLLRYSSTPDKSSLPYRYSPHPAPRDIGHCHRPPSAPCFFMLLRRANHSTTEDKREWEETVGILCIPNTPANHHEQEIQNREQKKQRKDSSRTKSTDRALLCHVMPCHAICDYHTSGPVRSSVDTYRERGKEKKMNQPRR